MALHFLSCLRMTLSLRTKFSTCAKGRGIHTYLSRQRTLSWADPSFVANLRDLIEGLTLSIRHLECNVEDIMVETCIGECMPTSEKVKLHFRACLYCSSEN